MSYSVGRTKTKAQTQLSSEEKQFRVDYVCECMWAFVCMPRAYYVWFYECVYKCITYTVEPRYNKVLGGLGAMKIPLLYQVSHYIRVKQQRHKELGPAKLPCYKRVLLYMYLFNITRFHCTCVCVCVSTQVVYIHVSWPTNYTSPTQNIGLISISSSYRASYQKSWTSVQAYMYFSWEDCCTGLWSSGPHTDYSYYAVVTPLCKAPSYEQI